MYLIAEIGNNHDGDSQKALDLVQAAIDSRVDAVKMQYFRADTLILKTSPRMAHCETHVTQYDRMRFLELPHTTYFVAASMCHDNGVEFIVSPFDSALLKSVATIVDKLKIASSEIANLPLLQTAADASLPLIMSTGMATNEEITTALNITGPCTLLHCVSIYPTLPYQVNLGRIADLRGMHPDCSIGYSDHTIGMAACLAAAALGAHTIEKHFTLKHTGHGDHLHSAEPDEMKRLVRDLHRIDEMFMPADGYDKDMRRYLRRGPSGLRGDYKCA